MTNARPIYLKLLIAALVIYVIGTAYILCDLHQKVGDIEHKLTHASPCSAATHK